MSVRICLKLAVAALCVSMQMRAVQADQSTVWELRPYRVHVLLAPDWDPGWTDQQIDRIQRSVRSRSRAEFGRPWQLDVGRASVALRRKIIGQKAPTDGNALVAELGEYRDYDKVILVVLRTQSTGRAAEAWELDWASKRWQTAPLRFAGGAGIEQAIFESIHAVMSPLGLVKMASGQRVVLRQRAFLLPERNHRRAMVEVGSVFEAIRRDDISPPSRQPQALLVVGEIGEQGLVCTVVARSGNPIEGTSLGSWIAIQCRPTYDTTDVRLTRRVDGVDQPLTQCTLWLADGRTDRGAPIGCPHSSGLTRLPAANKVQWLRLNIGAVTLREYCVFTGAVGAMTFDTNITDSELVHAGVLAECRDDVVQLLALIDVYEARRQHRVDEGREDAAKTLAEEQQAELSKRASEVLDNVNRRRAEITAQANVDGQFDSQWSELVEALKELQSDDS